MALLHGAGSTRSSVLDHAVVLARHGYGVLLFDARGHGRSGGRAMDFGWYGNDDVSAAVSFLLAQPGVDDERIAAVGLSMGGEEAIGAAAADSRIRAVVAEGATNRVASDKAWLSDRFGWRGAIQEGIEWLTYRTADLLTAADPPTSLRDAVDVMAPRPVLLIAGEERQDEELAGQFIAGRVARDGRALGGAECWAHGCPRRRPTSLGAPCHHVPGRRDVTSSAHGHGAPTLGRRAPLVGARRPCQDGQARRTIDPCRTHIPHGLPSHLDHDRL